MDESYLKQFYGELKKQILDQFLVVEEFQLRSLFLAFVARGHVLLEGPPGTGKTLTARLLAKLLAKSFKRIQFTTDLLPSDILGTHIFNQKEQSFDFLPGPIFSDIIVADEINRAPPRTQSALLEAMEERQVTLEGKTFELSQGFFVIATQNPQEFEGTFPLPEVQKDRFLMKLLLAHGNVEQEARILSLIHQGKLPPKAEAIQSISFDRERAEVELSRVKVDPSILDYVTRILHATRKNQVLQSGSSIRGGIALLKLSKINALLEGRDFVGPDDVKNLAAAVLRHRLILNPESEMSDITTDAVVEELLQKVPLPQ